MVSKFLKYTNKCIGALLRTQFNKNVLKSYPLFRTTTLVMIFLNSKVVNSVNINTTCLSLVRSLKRLIDYKKMYFF